MLVNERFVSIQGEGLDVGRLCAFLRFTACNIRCSYCDTPYAFHEGSEYALDDLVGWVHDTHAPMVCLTGGEPLLQPELPALAARLLVEDVDVVVETGGVLPIAPLPERSVKVMDVKTPGALRRPGEDPFEFAESRRFRRQHLHYRNLDELGPRDQVKFVLCDRADYDWARAFVTQHGLAERVSAVLFSPVHPGLDPRELVAWMTADQPPARLNLQVHKYVWGGEMPGV